MPTIHDKVTQNAMTAKHTKTPYYAVTEYTDNGEYSHCDIVQKDTGICLAQVLNGYDAAFIVRCVNSHDMLVDELEGVLHQLGRLLQDGGTTIDAEMREIVAATMADAEHVLTKATGES